MNSFSSNLSLKLSIIVLLLSTKELSGKRFTNGADKSFVVRKYAETYSELIACAEVLMFSSLGGNGGRFQKSDSS